MMNTQKKLEHLVEQLKQAFGARLLSVVLYGSAAAGDHNENFSDLNILCILSGLGLPELEASEPVFRWWRAQNNPAPLLLPEDELRTSTDCFPMEFHDIRQCHRILYGEDLVSSLEIDDAFYRAQVEYQIRSKLLRLRQKGAGVLQDKDLLLRLMADSISTFCVLGRHALLLSGVPAPVEKRDIVAAMASHFAIDAQAFQTLLDLREDKVKPGALDAKALFEQYLKGVAELAFAVDRLAR
ncbi:MAG: nucleotidyltransferase domain-containing protein [Acidobacteriia bacterium]|nr:nucleotidyltransferase domain-containing protein [Terriglobia bacterium]